MEGVLFNGGNVSLGSSDVEVAIDTGTTLIGGPPDVVQSIYSMIPGSQQASGAYSGMWAIKLFNTYLKV